jgi:hypothetical protein
LVYSSGKIGHGSHHPSFNIFGKSTLHVSQDFGKVTVEIFSTAMLGVSDNLAQCISALRGHKLRASLTILGLTMGVATLITVMTIVQGANLYVEQKIANLGTNWDNSAYKSSWLSFAPAWPDSDSFASGAMGRN